MTERTPESNRLHAARTKPSREASLISDLVADLDYYAGTIADYTEVPGLPVSAVPSKIGGERMSISEAALRLCEPEHIVNAMRRRIDAEVMRLCRIAPAVPAPWAWRTELSTEAAYDFMRDTSSATFRVRLVLVNGETGERVSTTDGLAKVWGQ